MKTISVIVAALLSVSAQAALELGPVSADTNATRTTIDVIWSLAGTNSTAPTVTVHWAMNDVGTNGGSWAYSSNLGVKAVGAYTNQLGALTPSRPWYARISALDESNTVWTTNYAYSATLAGAPTSAAPGHAYVPIMVGTNGVIVSPTGIVDFVTSGGVSLTNTDAIARRTITNQIATTDANMVWDVSGRIPVVTDESSDARYFVATQDAPGAPLQQLSPADARALMELGTAGTANLAGATWAQGEVPQAGTNTITYSGLVVYDADSGHVRQGTIDDAASMRASLGLGTSAVAPSGSYVRVDRQWISLGQPWLNTSYASVPGGSVSSVGFAFRTNGYTNAKWFMPQTVGATGALLRTEWAALSTEPTRTFGIELYAMSNSAAVGTIVLNPTNVTIKHSNGWGYIAFTNMIALPFGADSCTLSLQNGNPNGATVSNYLMSPPEVRLIGP